jgi:hypothetical protein
MLEDGLCFDYAIPGPPQAVRYQGGGMIEFCQRLYLPFTIHQTRLGEGRRMANFFTCQPMTPTRTRRYMWMVRSGQFDTPIHESQPIMDLIREQDHPIVVAQRPAELPYDLSEELHLQGSDAAAVAYRQHLARLGVEQ